MKKILVLSLVIVLFLGGVVGASSINGDYKGRPIVKVNVNGKTIVPEVPAQIIDGSTFLPLRAVAESLGAYVDWHGDTYSVDVTASNAQRSIDQIAHDGKDFNIEFVSYSASKEGHSTLTFFYNKDVGDSKNLNDYNYMLTQCPLTTAEMCKINDSTGLEVLLFVEDIRSFFRGEIDGTQLGQRTKVSNPQKPVQQQPVQQQPIQQPTTQPPASAAVSLEAPLLYSGDGKTYLGKLTSNTFDAESIFNEFGTYGSEFSTTSIFNEFGDYGSEFSDKSAFNDLASHPPIIMSGGKIIGHLTTNTIFIDAISPFGLKEVIKKLGF